MLLITFVSSLIKAKDFDAFRKGGSYIIPENMVGSRDRGGGEYEINCAVHTDARYWEQKVEAYEDYLRTWDKGYQK